MKEDLVWYASYGSNLLRDRIMCYINGGVCKYNGRDYLDGCKDKREPICDKPVMLPYKMYFGNPSSSWGPGGVSFLNRDEPGETYGRMYLIRKSQFETIWKLESKGSDWYNFRIHLNENEPDEIPIYTVTNIGKLDDYKPSDKYINVVARGLKETYPELSWEKIDEYLEDCKQIR